MTTQRVRVEPDAFAALTRLAAAASAQVSTTQADRAAPAAPAHRRRRGVVALAGAAVVLVAAALVVPGLVGGHPVDRAGVAALSAPQQPADQLYADDVARLAVDAASTRLLVITGNGAHYVARTPSGELCLVRVPADRVPTEVCVPDRVGADATIGTVGAGQVRLVAVGAPLPSPADGWAAAGPNVWVRD